MPFDLMVSTVAAVVVGNALSAAFIYALWRMTRAERVGAQAPLSTLLLGLIGPGITIYAFGWLVA